MLDLDQQNQLREQYQLANPGWRPATEVYASLARHYLQPDAQVLDLGCGRGGLVEQLDHPAPQIMGLDPDWLSLHEHRLEAIDRAAASSDQLPLRSQSSDLVLASWLFEHLPQPAKTLQQIYRVLKPGGVLLFITPNGRHPVAHLNRLLGRLSGVQGAMVRALYGRAAADTFATYYRANTEEQLQALSLQSGLAPLKLMTIADPTYLAFSRELYRLAALLEESLPQARKIHLVGALQRPR